MMNYGNFTNPHAYRVGDSVSAGDEIGQIPNLQTLEIHANLPQTDRGQVRNGEPVRARVSALPEARFTGRVARIAQLTSLDFSGSWPPPRIFQLAATLDHPDPRLRPQMTATVRVVTRRLRHVLLVPAQAVFTRRGKAIVYVRQNGAFRPRRVTVLGRNPTEAALRGLAHLALPPPPTPPARKEPIHERHGPRRRPRPVSRSPPLAPALALGRRHGSRRGRRRGGGVVWLAGVAIRRARRDLDLPHCARNRAHCRLRQGHPPARRSAFSARRPRWNCWGMARRWANI
jgi:hypothetical protein